MRSLILVLENQKIVLKVLEFNFVISVRNPALLGAILKSQTIIVMLYDYVKHNTLFIYMQASHGDLINQKNCS